MERGTDMALTHVHHENLAEAISAVSGAMEAAKDHGRFMVAVWSVADGKVHIHPVTTWQFPTGDMGTAVRMLAGHVDELCLENVEPLPEADLSTLRPVDVQVVDGGEWHSE